MGIKIPHSILKGGGEEYFLIGWLAMRGDHSVRGLFYEGANCDKYH